MPGAARREARMGQPPERSHPGEPQIVLEAPCPARSSGFRKVTSSSLV